MVSNDKKMDARIYFQNKKITLMGLGILGRGVGDAQYLAELGADLLITDLKSKEELSSSLSKLSRFKNISYRLGIHELRDFRNRDLVIKGASVPINSPFIEEARKNEIPVRMSSELFATLSNIPIIGITGTRGKTTTTLMIKTILEAAGKKVVLGGNIRDISTLALLPKVSPEYVAILELDSWQLQGFGTEKISPHVAVFTTFYPDHQKYYRNDLDLYLADKAQIFLNQKPNDIFILGKQAVEIVAQHYPAAASRALVAFSEKEDLFELMIPGIHNQENAACARAAAKAFGINEKTIRDALKIFPGAPGRLEQICTINNIKIYNDTTAVTPEATIAALEALADRPIILILGGSDKRLSMKILVEKISRLTKKVFFLKGTGTDTIRDYFPNATTYETLEEATKSAYVASNPGDTLLFSPAFSSLPMFKNVYDRGDQFNEIIKNIS
jgi:UDP-N-acetylmuramoylalanine--D-glutamate ligase